MLTGNNLLETLTDQLVEMDLPRMAASLDAAYRSPGFLETDRLVLVSNIIEDEHQARMTTRVNGRLKNANLLGCGNELSSCRDSSERSYLPVGIADTLATLDFVKDGLNVCMLGPSDAGKTWMAKAMGVHACDGFRVGYHHCQPLLEELMSLKETDFKKYRSKVNRLTRLDLVILDDFLLHTISDEREVKVLFELLEKRSEADRSTVVCSQREPSSWPSMMLNDEVAANAITKRVTKHYTVVIQPHQ